MVCPVAEAAQIVAPLLNGIAVVEMSTCNEMCAHNGLTPHLVFDALLAIAAAQESLDCPSMWQRQGASLHSFCVKLTVVAAKKTALRQSLSAAVEFAKYANGQHFDTLTTLLLHFATKHKSKHLMSTVLTLLCRMSWDVHQSFVSHLSSQDLNKLLLRCHDCYNDLAIFFSTFCNFKFTVEQYMIWHKATLKRQPDVHSLGATANLFRCYGLDKRFLREIASWAARASQDVAGDAVHFLYKVPSLNFCLPTEELQQLATVLPESPTLFLIYCKAARNGDYGGLEYLESFSQLDDDLIEIHSITLTRILKDKFDAAIRVCTRPGYKLLFNSILVFAFPKDSSSDSDSNPNIDLLLEPYRPRLETWRHDFLDRVVERCDYLPEDLYVLMQIQIDSLRKIGCSEVCRADLLKAFKENYGQVKVDCIHTLCEMAIVMQPRLEIDLRPCKKDHKFLLPEFDIAAVNILQTSRNQAEVIAVLDVHNQPLDGLKYVKNCLHEAAVHVYDTYKSMSYTPLFRRICDVLGQVEGTDLHDPEIPRWKEVAAVCTLGLNYGYDLGTGLWFSDELLSSPVIDYAKSLGGSSSDIERLYKPLGAIAIMALCTTDNYSYTLIDAISIVRDPRAPELAKYHPDEFSKIAVRIARSASFVLYRTKSKDKPELYNFAFSEIAWIFAYLPPK